MCSGGFSSSTYLITGQACWLLNVKENKKNWADNTKLCRGGIVAERVQTEHFGLKSRKSWDYLEKSIRQKDMPVKRSKRKFKAKQLVLDSWEFWINRLKLDIVAKNQQLSQLSPIRLLYLWLMHPEVPVQIQQGWSKTCPRSYKVALTQKE